MLAHSKGQLLDYIIIDSVGCSCYFCVSLDREYVLVMCIIKCYCTLWKRVVIQVNCKSSALKALGCSSKVTVSMGYISVV